MSDRDRDSPEVQSAMIELKKDGMLLGTKYKYLNGNQGVVLAAVGQNGLALQYASETLTNDKDVVLAAVRQNIYALQYAQKDAVTFIVGENGLALQFASETLRNDTEVVLTAFINNELALKYATDYAVRRVVLLHPHTLTSNALKYVTNRFQNNGVFMIKLVALNLNALEYVPLNFKDDIIKIMCAYNDAKNELMAKGFLDRYLEGEEKFDGDDGDEDVIEAYEGSF